jgi:NAD(P)-dependent dehydrogenase (short-subunit alcohol dehydrogenase family)
MVRAVEHDNIHPFTLSGRRILVTGAASGIGASTADLCGRLGAELILVDRDPITTNPPGATHQVDVSDAGALRGVIAAAGQVDGLVVAAAICPWDEDWLAPSWDESLRQVLDVNVKGTLNAVRAVLPGMIAQGRGRIVLVTSLAGRSGGLIAGPHYVASKGALHSFVKWVAQQAGPHGVTANAVAPASIRTPMMSGRDVDLGRIPLRRMGAAQEVAGPVAFLLSEAASYITGTVLDVNGGVWMAP